MPNALQEMAFDAASDASSQLRRFKSSYTRVIPGVTRDLNRGIRSINTALASSRDIQRKVRPLASSDWSFLMRLVVPRSERDEVRREAQSTLRLLSSAASALSSMRRWKTLLTASTNSVNAMVLPSPVNTCAKYNNFRASYQSVQVVLPNLITVLSEADQTITSLRAGQAQLVSDFNQTVDLVTRVRGVLNTVYDLRQTLWNAALPLGITAWGWRVIEMRESAWDRKSRTQKRDTLFRYLRQYRDDIRNARTALLASRGDLFSFLSGLPAMQRSIQAQKNQATTANASISAVQAPDVCPAGYSGLSQKSFVPTKSTLIPLAIGGVILGLLIRSDKKR